MLAVISHYKRTLLPLAAGIVLLCALFLVASSFLNPDKQADSYKGYKSSSRDGRLSDRSAINPNGEGVRSTTHQREKSISDTSGEKGKDKQTAKTSSKKLNPKDLVISQKGARSSSGIVNQSRVVDEKDLLRAELMEASYILALQSENPWRNLISVAKEYYRVGERDRAREILTKSLDLAIYPDDKNQTSNAVVTVFRGMLSLNQFSLAEKAFQNIPDAVERQKAMVVAASWAAVKGERETARRIISGITSMSGRDSAFVFLAASEAEHEGVSKAMQTALSISNGGKKDASYQRIALARGKRGDYNGASQAVQHINDEKVSESTNVSLAKIRAQAGDLHGSLGAIQYLKNPDVADVSLKNLSKELAISGRFSNSAFVSNYIRGDNQRSQALESLSVAQARSGDISGSLSRINAIPSEIIRNRSMATVSGITANHSTTGQARNIATMIDSEAQRDRAYKAIAVAASSAGNHVDAYNTMQQISGSDEKALALVSLARTRQKQGDNRAAFSMLEDADRFSQNMSPGNNLDKILSNMAVAYAERSGESSHSMSLASEVTNQSQRDKTFQKLAETFARKDLDAAQQSILSISSEKTKTTAEDSLSKARAKLCIHNGNQKEAIREARQLESSRQKIVFLLEVSRML